VLVHGGVALSRTAHACLKALAAMHALKPIPASEGFFAFQDSQKAEGLLLNTASGIFFEFVPAASVLDNPAPKRLSLHDVKVGEQYAVVLNSNAGLWGYNIGDTVKFVSLNPYRIVVSGRIKHFISAFGEHVIGEEVEHSLLKAAEEEGVRITEFTVAPMIQQERGKSYHEWFVEFEEAPADLECLCTKSKHQPAAAEYLLRRPDSRQHPGAAAPEHRAKGGFIDYMKSIGKLGGQNKVPRLSNDRTIADELKKWVV
jgi:hypothetical protein